MNGERRGLLRALAAGGAGLLAGCGGLPGAGGGPEGAKPDTSTTVRPATGQASTTAGAALAVHELGETVTVEDGAETGDVSVAAVEGRRQFFLGRLVGGGQRDVVGDPSRVYLRARVPTSWGEQAPDCIMPGDAFMRVVIDGAAFPIAQPCAYESLPHRGDGQVVFGLPTDRQWPEKSGEAVEPGEPGRVEWLVDGEPVAAWRLPDTAMAYLNDPPVFTVEDVAIPEQVPEGEEAATVTLTVANEGGRAGTFRYLTDSSVTTGVQLRTADVPPGETVETSGKVEVTPAGNTVRVAWGYDEREVQITVCDGNCG